MPKFKIERIYQLSPVALVTVGEWTVRLTDATEDDTGIKVRALKMIHTTIDGNRDRNEEFCALLDLMFIP